MNKKHTDQIAAAVDTYESNQDARISAPMVAALEQAWADIRTRHATCRRRADRAGRPAAIGPEAPGVDEAEIVVRTLEPPPEKLGVNWSSRLLGRVLGVSHVTVAKFWKKWDIQPWRTATFKFSTDPDPQTPSRARVAGPQPADPAARHPHLRVLAEPGRDLLRDHHPASIRRRTFASVKELDRDPPLHRRLERALRTVRLDQDRRRDPRTRQTQEA